MCFFQLGGCICDDEQGDISRFPTPTSHITVSTQRADRERIPLFAHQIILHPTTKRSPSTAEDNHHSLRAFTWIRFSHHHIVPPPKCFLEHPPILKSSARHGIRMKTFTNNLHALAWKNRTEKCLLPAALMDYGIYTCKIWPVKTISLPPPCHPWLVNINAMR